MPQSQPIVVNGTPTFIDVEDQTLAFTIAHALFNQPELGLVPILEPKTGQHHMTLTCPDPHVVAAVESGAPQPFLQDRFPTP